MTITEKDREDLKRFRDDSRFIEQQEDELTEKYPNKWIAVTNKKIVDINDDFDALLDDLKKKDIHPGDCVIELLSTSEDVWILAEI